MNLLLALFDTRMRLSGNEYSISTGATTITPTVSVVIPVYNRASRIKFALDSVFAQTFGNYEIVVVDDGSSDDTASIVEAVGSDKLRLLRHLDNRGPAAARNTGIQASRGRWIAFLDSDDSWKPEKLERQLAVLDRAGPRVKACASGYHLHKDGRELTISLKLSSAQFRREILFGCTISPGSTLLIDREVFSELGGFDEGLRRLEDWDWLLRFSERYDVTFIAEPLADVYLTTRKPLPKGNMADPVRDAIRDIGIKHLPHMASWTKKLQLRSSLLVEEAAALYRNDRLVAASLVVLMALIVYPARNASFFRTLWRSVTSRLS